MISILNFYPCNFHIFFKQLLFANSLKRRLVTALRLEYAAQYLGSFADVLLLESAQLTEVLVPVGVRIFVDFDTELNSCCRESGRHGLQVLDVEQAQLAEVLGSHLGLGVEFEHFDLAVDELEHGRHREVELERVEHAHFHVEDFLGGLGLVRDLHEVTHLRRLDFLLLAGDEHAGHAHQLQLRAVHVGNGQVAVDGGNCEVKSFGQQLELEVDFNQPVNQNPTHLFVDVGLGFHLIRVGFVVCLGFEAVVVHIHCVQRAVEGILAVPDVAVLLVALEVDAVDDGGIPAIHEVGLFLFLFEDFMGLVGNASLRLDLVGLVVWLLFVFFHFLFAVDTCE